MAEDGTGLYKRQLHPDRDFPSRDRKGVNSNEQGVRSVYPQDSASELYTK